MVGERESRQACSILGTKKGGEWVRKVVLNNLHYRIHRRLML